jgi:uncharacterized protein DUF1259
MRFPVKAGIPGLFVLLIGASTTPAIAQTTPGSSWSAVEDALGRQGAVQPGDVIKFSFPRSDLSVNVGSVRVQPAFALGSWIAFKQMPNGQAMVMGDIVLTEDETGVVRQELQRGGVEETGLHNHLLGETPRIMYMHISAHGDAAGIARTIRGALALSKTPLVHASPAAVSPTTDLDTAGISRALGVSGKLNGIVFQLTVPRIEKITEMGNEVPPSMGVATSINFQPTGGGNAAITGDLVLRGSEVSSVTHVLREHGIDVTALHSHMLDEEPRLFFMHFWANADAVTLAKGLNAALDHMSVRRK